MQSPLLLSGENVDLPTNWKQQMAQWQFYRIIAFLSLSLNNIEGFS